VRRVAEPDLHVTLAFLGWRSVDDIGPLWSAASDAAGDLTLPPLDPRAVVPVPRRRPRLLALDLEDPTGAAAEWHAAVCGALAAARLYEPERRPFWPHVTVARARKEARVRAPESRPDMAPFEATALALYRSDLSPQGARYTALERTG
jgi:2'-5' RNA ligase